MPILYCTNVQYVKRACAFFAPLVRSGRPRSLSIIIIRNMPAAIFSAAIVGLDAVPVEIEADITESLPNFIIVGLPDASVKEARERVRIAIKNSGLPFPRTKISVNLAPADIKKEGSTHDLAIALAILNAQGVPGTERQACAKRLFIGELAFNGELKPIFGALPIALCAAKHGFNELYVPAANAAEAAMVADVAVFAVATLPELLQHLSGQAPLPQFSQATTAATPAENESDFGHIKGHFFAKRALEVAAAGGHNVLLNGPPGSGKTLLAQTLPTILPPMTLEETLEVTKIYSVAGLTSRDQPSIHVRPFRAPHHTASSVAVIGGGSIPKPGEVTLAHRGVLFLDELPEFSRFVLESLRQPLEDGAVTISRAHSTLKFPARSIFIAAQNPCPCGYATDQERSCTCAPFAIAKYRKKISGPLLDRIDLHIEVPRLKSEEYFAEAAAESSAAVRARVVAARQLQTQRFANLAIATNAEMRAKHLRQFCTLGSDCVNFIKTAAAKLQLSPRAISRTIKVARTIADLGAAERITKDHVSEAIQYRQ